MRIHVIKLAYISHIEHVFLEYLLKNEALFL